MLHICLWEDLVDIAYIDARTEGFAELKRRVRDYTPQFVAQTCGISEDDLVRAARWFGQAKASLSLYCQGLNQSSSGTAKNAALINLHLATCQIGKPGAGPFSLTGQPNAMGGREVSTRGRDIDITGLSYRILEEQGPQQWPFPEGAAIGKKRLYVDGVFPTGSGRARFVNTVYKPVAEAVDARHPFRLTTGRLRDQWHGMSRTGTVARLFAHVPEPAVMLSQADINRRLIGHGNLVHVTSRPSSQILPAVASDEVRPGQAFIAMHWGEEYVSGRGHDGEGTYGVNALTLPALDPSSRQPEFKHAAVKIVKADLPWRFAVFGWMPEAQFGITGADVLRYDDARRANARHILVRDGKLEAVSLAGDTSAEQWLKDFLESEQPVAQLGRLLLMPSYKAPQGVKARGRIVCNCFSIGESEIAEVIPRLHIAGHRSPQEFLALSPGHEKPRRCCETDNRLRCLTVSTFELGQSQSRSRSLAFGKNVGRFDHSREICSPVSMCGPSNTCKAKCRGEHMTANSLKFRNEACAGACGGPDTRASADKVSRIRSRQTMRRGAS